MQELNELNGYESIDFMQLFDELTEQILQSVCEERKNDTIVLLSTLVYHADNLFKQKLIDKKLYYHTLNFFENILTTLFLV